MGAFRTAFGGTFGVLLAIGLACMLGVGGCVFVCGGVPLLIAPAVEQAREAAERSEAKRKAKSAGAESASELTRQDSSALPVEEVAPIDAGETEQSESASPDDSTPQAEDSASAEAEAEKKAAEEAAANEKRAAGKLASAKGLRNANKAAYRARLQEIVDKFPGTKAAEEASQLLK